MTFGERLTYARKQKGLRQSDLAGTSGDTIGKYERVENAPSIQVVSKMADSLGVTIDYLVKDGVYENIDSVTIKRLKEFEKPPVNIKENICFFIDTNIEYHKTKQAQDLNLINARMKVLLDIKDSKAGFVMELLNNLSGYVKAKPLTEPKARMMEDLSEAVEEIKRIREGKKKARNAEDFLNEL